MSHWTTVKTQIKDIKALQAAAKELGLQFIKNGIARGYGKQTKTAPYVIGTGTNCPYDIAVEANADGTFGLVTDWWNGHVEKLVGKGFSKLTQLYGVHKATLEAKKKGFMVARKQLNNGGIQLTVTGGFN